MCADPKGVIANLGQMKLDHMLEEFSLKDPIPEIVNIEDYSHKSSDDFGSLVTLKTWYQNKDWKMFAINFLQKQNKQNRLETA